MVNNDVVMGGMGETDFPTAMATSISDGLMDDELILTIISPGRSNFGVYSCNKWHYIS